MGLSSSNSDFTLQNPPTDLHDVRNKSASQVDPNSVNIGPTKVDFSMIEVKTQPSTHCPQVRTATIISGREKSLMRRWKNEDLAQYYREQNSNYY